MGGTGRMSFSRQKWIRSSAQVGGLAFRMEHVDLCSRNFIPTGQKQNMCLQMLTGGVIGIGAGQYSLLIFFHFQWSRKDQQPRNGRRCWGINKWEIEKSLWKEWKNYYIGCVVRKPAAFRFTVKGLRWDHCVSPAQLMTQMQEWNRWRVGFCGCMWLRCRWVKGTCKGMISNASWNFAE